MWLSGLSNMVGTNPVTFTELSRISGVVDVPAVFFQPVDGSQRSSLTCVLVVFCQAHAARISPLCVTITAGYLSRPDESMAVAAPKVKPVILF